MCNRLNQSSSETETLVLFDQNQNQVVTDNNNMDSPPPVTSPDEAPRVKFLCSFGGSILPRPQDGKLRYVGGETRIVSLPREINYEELMLRMKELFEGATSLKYQQPDEDLDALVSVVNDDDVTNMMEEYDKLGSGDGFTRLRMFLFSHPDYDSSSMVGHFETDDRETERRYVDALNSLNESPRKQPSPESPVTIPVGSEQFFNPVTPEFGIHNQRNSDALLPQFNLRELRIPPHLGSGQHQIETSMSPAYYSPRHHGHHDPRTMTEYPTSPGSGRYRMGFGELPPDHSLNHQLPPSPYEHQPPFPENVVWLPPGAIPVDNGGFPGNLSNTSSVIEGGNSICDNCRMTFQRCPNMPDSARYPDSRWRQQHLEPQPNIGNEFHQLGDPCVQCTHGREAYMVNQDGRLDYGMGNDHLYIDAHGHDRGWVMHHQLSNRREEARGHISGAGRVNEQYVVDGPGLSFHHLHGNCVDGHQASSNCVSHEDPRYVRAGSEFGNEGFHDQAVGVPPQIHVPISEDRGVRYGNMPAAYGADNLYQVSHGPASTPVPTPVPAPTPTPSLWIKVHNPLHNVPSYEALNMLPQANGSVTSGFVRGVHESSPRFHNGLDNQNPWVGPQQKMFGYEGTSTPEFQHGYAPKLNLRAPNQENQNSFPANSVCSPQELSMLVEPVPHTYSPRAAINDANHSSSSSRYIPAPTNGTGPAGPMVLEEKRCLEEASGMTVEEKVEDFNCVNISSPDIKETNSNSNGLQTNAVGIGNLGVGETGLRAISDHEKLTVKYSSFIPELVASVKKVALEDGEEVKAGVQGEAEGEVTTPDMEDDSDNDHKNISKIEPTKAEEEALAEGLQTIRNDDLEEIRELGSGTYGSVYYGKWKGSDVAIKRIKASCFAGRPSERERLIADFWKEASKLSGLRHPNVVSFYGIVRDSPDGCLATVTEFMVNGSLKQFIRKKDRTIDRRKRLIIAMDAAFGMEYLHEKNIVHFDLKCENLLVNMRDPHRPVCKIGDLGLSKVKQHTLVSGGVRGTLPWMAPELLSGTSNMVSEKIDVYSFGIVMWELLTGEEPYADMHGASLIGGVVHNSLRPEVPSWCDPEWKSLMESCWSSEPGERPSFSEISQRLRKMSATSK